MKRYDPVIEWFYGYEAIPEAEMEEDRNGEYVKYEDVKKVLECIMQEMTS